MNKIEIKSVSISISISTSDTYHIILTYNMIFSGGGGGDGGEVSGMFTVAGVAIRASCSCLLRQAR